jgi:hypothetical protein
MRALMKVASRVMKILDNLPGSLGAAPNGYVRRVAEHAGIPEEHVRPYVRNIRPHRFLVTPEDFAKDIKPVYEIKEHKYNPLQKGLAATTPDSEDERKYLRRHGKKLDSHFNEWVTGQKELHDYYRGYGPRKRDDQ